MCKQAHLHLWAWGQPQALALLSIWVRWARGTHGRSCTVPPRSVPPHRRALLSQGKHSHAWGVPLFSPTHWPVSKDVLGYKCLCGPCSSDDTEKGALLGSHRATAASSTGQVTPAAALHAEGTKGIFKTNSSLFFKCILATPLWG